MNSEILERIVNNPSDRRKFMKRVGASRATMQTPTRTLSRHKHRPWIVGLSRGHGKSPAEGGSALRELNRYITSASNHIDSRCQQPV
jgi:hypothetical protein